MVVTYQSKLLFDFSRYRSFFIFSLTLIIAISQTQTSFSILIVVLNEFSTFLLWFSYCLFSEQIISSDFLPRRTRIQFQIRSLD